MGRRINVGCGPYRLKGWENYDRVDLGRLSGGPWADWTGDLRLVGDWREIDLRSAETVFAGHFLEHLPIEEARGFLSWARGEASLGELVVAMPVLDGIQTLSWEGLQDLLSYGFKGRYPGYDHKTGWRTWRNCWGGRGLKSSGGTTAPIWRPTSRTRFVSNAIEINEAPRFFKTESHRMGA